MTSNSELFYQEFVAPLYEKYADDPNFIKKGDDNNDLYDIQYALLKESDVFTPIEWQDEAKGMSKVIGFFVEGYPQYLLADAQYSYSGSDDDSKSVEEKSPESFALFEYAMGKHMETGVNVEFLLYVGLGDAFIANTITK